MLCYDVSDNKKRLKIQQLCTKQGWIMVQKSIYLKCSISIDEKDQIKDQIEAIDTKYPHIFDTIVIVNIDTHQLKSVDQIGYEFPFSSFIGDSRLEII